jgi:hypothetical protein
LDADDATRLESILRALDGLGLLLMSIDANVEAILATLENGDDEEEADT